MRRVLSVYPQAPGQYDFDRRPRIEIEFEGGVTVAIPVDLFPQRIRTKAATYWRSAHPVHYEGTFYTDVLAEVHEMFFPANGPSIFEEQE